MALNNICIFLHVQYGKIWTFNVLTFKYLPSHHIQIHVFLGGEKHEDHKEN